MRKLAFVVAATALLAVSASAGAGKWLRAPRFKQLPAARTANWSIWSEAPPTP